MKFIMNQNHVIQNALKKPYLFFLGWGEGVLLFFLTTSIQIWKHFSAAKSDRFC